MSFFNDFLESFKLNDTAGKTIVSMIVDVGIMVVGKIKILNLDDQKIIIKSNKDILHITGEKLKIKSLAKGEIVVAGSITEIGLGDKNG